VLLVVAVAIGELTPIRVGQEEGEVAPSTTFTFALLLAYGVPAAVLGQAIGSLTADAFHGKPALRRAFNVAQYTIAIAAAGLVFELLSSSPEDGTFSIAQLLAMAAAGCVFFAVNTGSVAIVVAITTGTSVREQVSSSLLGESVTEAILIGLAPLAVLAVETNLALLPLLALPLFAVQRAGRHARLNERMALHDALTGLPNRALLADRLGHALTLRARRQTQLAVLLLDLDRFKVVNDSLGHDAGDQLLRHVAAQLEDVVRTGDTVARLGGDEFVVVLEHVSSPEEPSHVAARILERLSEPVTIGGSDIVVGASVGIVIPEGDEEPDTLLRHADLAMYRAKAHGRGRHEQFVDELAVGARERLATETALRLALADGQLFLAYQPIVDLSSGDLVAVEALVRWRHPERGVLAPAQFLPVARDAGLLPALTQWVLQEALAEMTRWKAADPGGRPIRVHVNVPPVQLTDPHFADRVLELLAESANAAADLCLEVTEDALVEVAGPGLDMLRRLRESGIRVALDDFGTGYSSLSQLRQLPVDTLKIDLSFVAGIASPGEASIVRTIIDLAHALGIAATAEGIESERQAKVLLDLGCDSGQGFRFGRPVPDFPRPGT
jgi:diguanylate cyclase (GGDEF)-like protein